MLFSPQLAGVLQVSLPISQTLRTTAAVEMHEVALVKFVRDCAQAPAMLAMAGVSNEILAAHQ